MNNSILIGTTNPGKRREMAALIMAAGLKPVFRDDLPEIAETANSYKGNAKLKSQGIYDFAKMPVISEDSGLSVDALDGAPGLMSARWTGATDHNSSDMAAKLLKLMKNEKNRRASFITAASISDGGKPIIAQRSTPGIITSAPRGDKGFSYDTVFQPKGKVQTWAESGDKSDSARDKAVKAVLARYMGKHASSDSIDRLATDFANGPKWHDADTDREYKSHMNEFASEGTYKNLVDAAIIKNIKARIAMKEANDLLSRYDKETKMSYKAILAKRLAKFREYEHIPFPIDNA